MFQNEKSLSFSRIFLLIVIVINILLLISAYVNHKNLFFVLIWSIPLLLCALYYNRIISKKAAKNRKINSNDFNFNEKGNSIFPGKIKDNELTVLFGNSYCAQPYLSSIICLESVSADQNINFIPKQIVLSEDNDYSQDLIQRLNDGLFIDDSIWRIGSDYAGCRDRNYKFNAEAFKVNAVRLHVKMIELKLSGFNDKGNLSARNISYSKQTNDKRYTGSGVAHTAFRNAESMVIFLDSLRQLSGKKPVGISLSITDKKEFHEMCYAFCKTHIIPDFIVVEGCAKEAILLNNVSSDSGMPLFEALQFVAKTLEIYGISKETKIIAASEIHTAFDILKLRALGADALSMRNRLIRSAKPYQKGDINETAFARQSMERLRNEILNSTMDVMQAWGYKHIKDITLSSFFRILDALQMKEDHKGNGRAGRDIVEKKNHRLSQKSLYEKNTGAEVFLN